MAKPEVFPDVPVLTRAEVVLASGSPRRRELLGRLLPPQHYHSISTDVDETQHPGEDALEYVSRLCVSKALAGVGKWRAQERESAGQEVLVIGADTTVVLEGKVFGKPGDEREAIQFLRELSGKIHQVVTGMAAALAGADGQVKQQESCLTSSDVEFRELSDAEIEWYVATGEPNDKAGGYAIQGYGGLLISNVYGDYYNIVGLPVSPLIEMLRKF